ncbi:CDK5 regulatory subunit-associated protein 3 [Planococcus citri]|uniref:CDK5 regulatory subunit-associated protein 3 n=1 Tax=Planococcus citri TaxID=170843 RepID=UPI0031F7C8D5
MEDNIPIDIHIPKLLEWLLDRRHCKKDWQAQITSIREKINAAIQDMPENESIKELLSGSYLNYFHCCQIVEILKETEADTKNLFGMYGSQRMKDWQEIVRLYQKDNVYLAESANILLRNVKYEVPGIKKQIAKLKQLQQECEKKIADYIKSASSAQRELESMKKQIGISGNNVQRELLSRVSHLNEVYANVTSNIKVLEKALQHYIAFSQMVAGITYELPLISYVIEKGNTTTYEWLYGEPPQKIELPDTDKLIDDSENNAVSDEIDWDISEVNDTDIDYGISLEESGIEVETAEKETNVARGVEAYTVLDNPKTRDEFISQLMELQSFLKMRLLETQKDSVGLSLMNEQVQESSENLVKMLDSVQVVKQLLTDSVTQQLHFIKHSKRYVEKVASSFDQKLNAVEKMKASQEAMKIRKQEVETEEAELKPKLKILMNKTRTLQEQIESEISKKYKNRPVNLMGGF